MRDRRRTTATRSRSVPGSTSCRTRPCSGVWPACSTYVAAVPRWAPAAHLAAVALAAADPAAVAPVADPAAAAVAAHRAAADPAVVGPAAPVAEAVDLSS